MQLLKKRNSKMCYLPLNYTLIYLLKNPSSSFHFPSQSAAVIDLIFFSLQENKNKSKLKKIERSGEDSMLLLL